MKSLLRRLAFSMLAMAFLSSLVFLTMPLGHTVWKEILGVAGGADTDDWSTPVSLAATSAPPGSETSAAPVEMLTTTPIVSETPVLPGDTGDPTATSEDTETPTGLPSTASPLPGSTTPAYVDDKIETPTSTPPLPSSRPGASDDPQLTPTAAPTEKVASSQLPPPGGNCVYPAGYWPEHPEAWSVDQLNLGDQVVDQRDALKLLSDNPQKDASLKLAQALIVAKLNAWNGADWRVAAEDITAADNWFTGRPAGSKPVGAEAERAESLAARLDEFNQGLAGTPACPSWEPTPAPTLTATPTAPEPSPSPRGTAIPTATEPEPPTPEPTLETPTEAPPPTAPVEEAPPATLESTPPAADPIDTLPPSEEAPPAETALP